MTGAVLLNRLISQGHIERVRVNRYRLNDTAYIRSMRYSVGGIYNRPQIHAMFYYQIGENDYRLRYAHEALTPFQVDSATQTPTQTQTPPPVVERPRPLRRITRDGYHENGNGTGRRGCAEALARIARDADGVRRSFGLEWEIYNLNEEQESKLAYLLDTLPAHFTERDGSLGSRGVEIIFLPLGEAGIRNVFHRLQDFCRAERIEMGGTGAHITYGVSNSEATEDDIQIRINRIALAVKAASTQAKIKEVFGRDFTGYARLPGSTTHREHSNAWNASRGNSAYELRLCNWAGNIDKITEFMKATEFVFHRPFTAQDFINIFTIMGSDCAGE